MNRTLVMTGDDDEVTLEHAIAMYRGLDDAELMVVPGTSHRLLVEKPTLYATPSSSNSSRLTPSRPWHRFAGQPLCEHHDVPEGTIGYEGLPGVDAMPPAKSVYAPPASSTMTFSAV